MHFSRHHLLALILGAGMTSALPAQVPPPSPPRAARGAGVDRGVASAARRAAGPAQMLINQREKLALTDEQVTQLQALEASDRPQLTQGRDLLALRTALQDASRGEANVVAVRSAMEKINKLETDMLVARLEARNKARAILTADQQVQFDAQEASRPMQLPGMGGRGEGRGGSPGELPSAGAKRATKRPPPATPATN